MQVKAKQGRCAVKRSTRSGHEFIELDDLDEQRAIELTHDMNVSRGEPAYCIFLAINDEGQLIGPRVVDPDFDLLRLAHQKGPPQD